MASGPSVPKSEVPAEALAIGTLIGLLIDLGERVEVNLDWVADPLTSSGPSLRDAETRLDSLVAFLAGVLTAAPSPPAVFAGAQWYGVPGLFVGGLEPTDPQVTVAVVAPSPSADAGQIGLGVLVTTTSGNLEGEIYAYLPLFEYDRTGTRLTVGHADHPARIGVRGATVDKKGFTSGAVGFDALGFTVDLPFDEAAYGRGGLIALEFENLSGTDKPARYTTLGGIDADVESWVGSALIQATSWLDQPIGNTPVRIADLLVGANVLQEAAPPPAGATTPPPYVLDLSVVRTATPLEIALNALFGAIDALAEGDYAAVDLPGGGLFFLRRENADQSVDYGLRVAFDFALTEAGGGVPSGSRPDVELQVGTWLTGETDETSWITRSEGGPAPDDAPPGVNVFALRRDPAGELSFAPSASLRSIGVNVRGAGSSPLVAVGGFTLKGVELRTYLEYRSALKFGAAVRLDDGGLSLAPKAGAPPAAGASNPAATSVIASATKGGGDPTPVNPALSMSVAYVEGGKPAVAVYDQSGAQAQHVTIPIQRGLGPITANSLDVGWAHDMLTLGLDGAIAIGGLGVSVHGLTVGVPIAHPDDFSRYQFDLDGLGITFQAGAVDLSAAFVRLPPDTTATPPRPFTEYAGEALLKAGDFALSALGAYAYVPDPATGDGYGSLFIFAVLDGALGGPPYFYVTGVAAGFGYNRRLILPEQDAVTTFPLVAAASDPTKLGAQRAADGTLKKPDPMAVLTRLDRFVPAERGQYWLAAGVRFGSFDVIQSTALLVVEFGQELEIALLGVSSVTLPPTAVTGSVPRLAYAELGLEVKLLPAAGTFTATAVLSPSSFVIDPACKLTGGFAFYAWFGRNPHAGEFVLTLGGYHPHFSPPDYYPRVPRLGFNWPVGGGVTITGNAYFALTPSAVMAGGGLQVLYEKGNLRAWFRAQMDALVEWAPLHYELTIDVSVGASYRVHFLFVTTTLSVELGAQLTLWGPPTGGTVRIEWFVISFTIGFGADRNSAPAPLEWRNAAGTGFAQRLIPNVPSPVSQPRLRMAAAGTDPQPASPPQGGVFTIAADAGLITTFQDKHETVWVVRRDFAFSATTAIPVTSVVLEAPADRRPTEVSAAQVSPAGEAYFVCIRPMRATLSASTLTVGMHALTGGQTEDLAGNFDFHAALVQAPAAKWGRPLPRGAGPEMTAMLPGRLVGVESVRPKAPVLTPSGEDALDVLVKNAMAYETVDFVPGRPTPRVPLDAAAKPVRKSPQALAGSTQVVHDTLASPTATTVRDAIYAALAQYGSDPGANGSLEALAADPGAYLTSDPLVAA
jgi:Family of unknown function (DUF6603)